MATTTDFPNSCSTNTVVLVRGFCQSIFHLLYFDISQQDFGEVAYIVCTVATPPTGPAVQAPAPETTIARLRQTEAQFRNASVLAALDVDSFQLFTFYKKVDVMKDQRTLLAKFGNIVRSNSCIISYKAAVRAPDLLKPDHAKLYRLFISAILASVELASQDGCQILTLGERYHVLENGVSENFGDETVPTPWTLIRTDLQVVRSGQVLLTLVVDTTRTLFTISDFPWQWKSVSQSQPNGVLVVIAPFGHLATYKGGWIGSWNDVANAASELGPESVERLRKWRQLVTNRSSTDTEMPYKAGDDGIWVELQIPRAMGDDILPVEIERGHFQSKEVVEFKPAFWPAHLCFTLRHPSPPSQHETNVLQDPVKFVQDWINTSQERLAQEEHDRKMAADSEDDEQDFFADDSPFNNQESFQSFGPPAFAASQMIYPTPPDVVMTHATPGMSSVDGTAMTPANGGRAIAEARRPSSQELEMTDVDPTQAAAIGSGFYDEDLFEEMPDDNFDHAGGGDEPNWDFFDKPDMDVDLPGVKAEAREIDNNGIKAHRETDDPKALTHTGVTDSLLPDEGITAGAGAPSVEKKPHRQISTEPFPNLDPSAQSSVTAGDIDGRQGLMSDNGSSVGPERRRSSIYEISRPAKQSVQQDSRYTTQGMFWFDTSTGPDTVKRPYSLAGWSRRTPSSSSASDVSTSEDGASPTMDDEGPQMTTQWTLYEPISPEEEKFVPQVDTDAIEKEARDIFDHLKSNSLTLSLESDMEVPKKPSMGIPKDKPGLHLLFSQLFVEQYAQSTLVRSLQPDKAVEVEAKPTTDLGPNLSNLNSNATYATLGQLSGASIDGRLMKLTERQIKLKRGEKDMMASISIIPFWDTLGLQPQGKPKDVTCFCIHPAGSGVADGCTDFLERIADAYSSCSLGLHKLGKITNLTHDGLLVWSLEKDKPASPMPIVPIAMRLGDALAQTEEVFGTVVVYIVGLSADPFQYLQCCAGFWACYQAYRKKMGLRNEKLELVPQVIPASFVASTETVVVPCQSDYNSLALEVYGRLPPSNLNSPAGFCEFPVALADPMDSVQFSLTAQPISPFSSNGVSLHLAYSHSDDQRWMVACWTDETGQLVHTMAYLLRVGVRDRGRPEKDIIQDMWEISQDLMKPHRSRWRLIVSRVGFYGIAEDNFWKHLANAEASEQKSSFCTLQLLSIELRPSLQLTTLALQAKSGQVYSSGQANTYGTPASTPQAITTSPEQLVPATPTPGGTSVINAPTPPEQGFDANIDGELSLIDLSEESWMLVLPFGMNQSYDIHEAKQALASGYLIKRIGLKDEDGVCSIGVHLKHSPEPPAGSPTQYEEVLENIIRQFRGLVTLAAARGSIDKVKQCVPWHIHVAVTGARGLSGLIY